MIIEPQEQRYYRAAGKNQFYRCVWRKSPQPHKSTRRRTKEWLEGECQPLTDPRATATGSGFSCHFGGHGSPLIQLFLN
jgi:hypothetical protein